MDVKSNSFGGNISVKRQHLVAYGAFGSFITIIVGYIIGILLQSEIVQRGHSMDLTETFFKELNANNIRQNLRYLTNHTHIAGSVQEEEILVDYLVEKWRGQLDKVEVYPYEVMLSLPNTTDPNYVGVIDEEGKIFDKSLVYEYTSENVSLNYNAYGDAGHVEGDMVFVNYGRAEDFATLADYKIEAKNKICIVKYGKIFRGQKSINAEKYGCLGLIIYIDPADYTDYNDPDNIFPQSWYMPSTGVQKGSLWCQDGDPLTPIYPSIKSSYKLEENMTCLPSIPVQPICYADARKYLSKLGGPVAPASWWGKLHLTYRLGASMLPPYEGHRFVLHVGNFRPVKVIRNVIGYIYGSLEPDRFVILGNHRDAWDFGAVDPSSATAVMMEVARVTGETVKKGLWRPRRTIMFCSWAAEEFGLIGSVEWTEEFEKKLFLQAVTYLNVDIAVEGKDVLSARGSPSLQEATFQAAKRVPNPDPAEISNGRTSVYDTWKHLDPNPQMTQVPPLQSLGSGSDYLMFMQKVGVSSFDFVYSYDQSKTHLSSYPIYHSAFETIDYFETFLDPEYKFSLAIAQLWMELTRMFADGIILPFSPVDYAEKLNMLYENVITIYAQDLKENEINMINFLQALKDFKSSALEFEKLVQSVDENNFLECRILNDKLMYLERGFLDFQGLPGKEYYRHAIFSPSNNDYYAPSEFPGLIHAILNARSTGNWDEVKKQLSIITFHINSAASTLQPF